MAQLFVRGLVLAVALLFTGAAILNDGDEGVVIKLVPSNATSTDASSHIDVVIETDKSINALGGTVVFPPEIVAIDIIENPESFIDIWLTQPEVSVEKGEVTFAGGTNDKEGLLGEGIVFSLAIATTSTEYAEILLTDLEVFENDGQGTALSVDGRTYIVNPKKSEEIAQAPAGGGESGASGAAPDLNGDGKVNLGDLSIMLLKIVDTYDERYDLNGDERVGLGDLSVLMTSLGNTE